ncbi:AAA family ATPase [Phenylobacterium sp.]|jgi:adenylate kinase family enzyme|uniref:AAA family ATPase n=1 Tax=Phenylobacterium sp. TaxID=1871053 RepID=UPI002F3E1F98
MRLLMLGSTGSGKSTFARALARRIGAPYVELDALNWDPNWTNLSRADPDQLRARVRQAIAPDAWTCDGNYSVVRPLILERATHLVWLDYPRAVIMARVIRRSFARAIMHTELWPGTGNYEEFHRWFGKEHPIRWAWDTYHHRRAALGALFDDPSTAGLVKQRLRHPREAAPLMDRLAAEALSI